MTTWVFLRGLIREQRHWGQFPAQFRQALQTVENEADAANIVTLDLPGNGSLHQAASPTRIEDMAAFCRSELAARGLAPPYRVLALSLGAMVAVAWCRQYPEEIDACVLINTSLRPFSPFYRRLRPHNYPKLIGSVLRGNVEQRERLILQLTSCGNADPHTQAALLRDWVAFQREFPVSLRNTLRQLRAAMGFRAPLKKPAVPILVLGSTHDGLVDNRCSLALAQQWQTASAFHPSAGHDLPLDDGPWVSSQIRTWLAAKTISNQATRIDRSTAPKVIMGLLNVDPGKPDPSNPAGEQ